MEKRLSTRRLDRLLPLCVLCVLSVLGAGTDSKACMCPLILALESFRFTPHPGSFALVNSSSTPLCPLFVLASLASCERLRGTAFFTFCVPLAALLHTSNNVVTRQY